MGVTKTKHYTDAQNETANLLKAIAHPARVAIIEFLIQTNSCICNDIVGHLPLSQATVSQHLRELKNAGIIQGTVEGKAINYCINKEAVQKLELYFSGIFRAAAKLENRCC